MLITLPVAVGAGASSLKQETACINRDTTVLHLSLGLLERRLMRLLRFKEGAIYSCSVSMGFSLEAPSSPLPLRGEASVRFSCDPAEAWALVQLTLDAARGLASGSEPASAEEIATALELEKRAFELAVETNAYWAGRAMSCLTSHRWEGDADACYTAMEEARAAALASLSPQSVQACFRDLVAIERNTAVVLLPREFGATARRVLQRVMEAAAESEYPYTTAAAAVVAGVGLAAAGAMLVLRAARSRQS